MTQETLFKPLTYLHNSPSLRSVLVGFLACLALFTSACGELLENEVGRVDGFTSELVADSDIDITITSPKHGQFKSVDWTETTIEVSGALQGVSGPGVEVIVNDEPATVASDGTTLRWSVYVPVSREDVFNWVVAELIVGGKRVARDVVTVIIGDSLPRTTRSPKSSAVRLTDSGLDQIEPIIASQFPIDFSKLMPTGEFKAVDTSRWPIDDAWKVLVDALMDKVLDARIVQSSVTGIRVDADAPSSSGDKLIGRTIVSNVFVRTRFVVFDEFFDTEGVDLDGISCTVDLSIDALTFEGKYELKPGTKTAFNVVQHDSISTHFDDPVWDFSSGPCSIPGLEDLIEEFAVPVLQSRLESQLKRLFDAKVEGEKESWVVDSIEAALNEIDFTNELAESRGMTIETKSAVVDGHSDGYTFGADVGITADTSSINCRVPPSAPDLSEYLYVPAHFPEFDRSTPVGGLPYDAAVALSPTALNQFLLAETVCRGSEQFEHMMKFPPRSYRIAIFAGVLDNYIPGFSELYRMTRLELRLRPTMAPIVTGEPGPHGEAVDLRFGGYRFEFVDQDGTVHVGGYLGGRIGVALSMVGDKLLATAHPPTESDIEIRISDNLIGAEEEEFEELLPAMVAPLLPGFSEMIESIPLPGMGGLELVPIEVGNYDGSITLFGEIVPPSCGFGEELDGGLCYPTCEEGYEGYGGTCFEECPASFIDGHSFCQHDFESFPKPSDPRGVGTLPICGGSLELDGRLCYPSCNNGYDGEGPLCWKRCPTGYVDDGFTCRKPEVIKWKDNYTRGAGTTLKCASNEQYDAGLCYPKCKTGYVGVGPTCYEKTCPDGYHDDGLTCSRPPRSIWTCGTCPAGYRDDGCICTRDAKVISKDSYDRGVGKPVHACPSGTERNGALCYPVCNNGYTGDGPVCWQNCPNGYNDDGASCSIPPVIISQQSYGRGVGTIPWSCPTGKEMDDGFCYDTCKNGYHGIGPVCYQDCPEVFTDKGLYCEIQYTRYPKETYKRVGLAPVAED